MAVSTEAILRAHVDTFGDGNSAVFENPATDEEIDTFVAQYASESGSDPNIPGEVLREVLNVHFQSLGADIRHMVAAAWLLASFAQFSFPSAVMELERVIKTVRSLEG